MANVALDITVVGNLTADPELRQTQTGIPVANISVAHNERVYNRQTNQWEDGEPTFLRGAVWRELGEHVAASMQKGQRVIVRGKLRQRNYEDRDGQRRTAYEVEIDDIGPSLQYGTTQFTKSQKGQQNAQAAPQVAQQAPQAPVNAGYAPQGAPVQQAPVQQPVHQAAPVQQAPAPQAQPQAVPTGVGADMSDDAF